MRIVHVVPHVDDEAAGPSYSVPRLCESLAALGHDVELSCLAARSGISGVRIDVHAQWPFLDRFAISPSHARALWSKARRVDIVHNHSLWSMVNVAAGWAVPGHHAKLVTSPRGTLSPWALARRRDVKRLLWPLQRRVLTQADLLHATSADEYADVRACGLAAPVVVIPNGIDLPELPPERAERPERTLLFLGRLHPVKGIDRLLQAWQRLQDGHPDWRLSVVGRGEPAHERAVHELVHALALQRVDFAGPLYGSAKSRAYFGADLFVLPSHSENFGVAVAEALSHRCPTVVSRGAPWSGLAEEGCGWWVKHDVPVLAQALDEAMSSPRATLAAMGARGRRWMERDFAWTAVARRMEEAYRWILSGGVPPSCARIA